MRLKKILCDSMTSFDVLPLWKFKTQERFNVLCIGTLFRQSGLSIVAGGEDGIIRIFDLNGVNTEPKTAQITLETKSGPIQTMAIHDVTKFYHNDLIVGDSRGMLTVFCNQQILSRQPLCDDCLSCLQVQEDATGNVSIIAGTDLGQVYAVLPSQELWNVNLNDFQPPSLVSVKCILTVDITDQQGKNGNYVLVADNHCHIHVLQDGTLVTTLTAPAVVTAMAQGHFISSTQLGWPAAQNGVPNAKESQQVALGSAAGAIYIMQNFLITLDEYANTQSPITRLVSLPQPDSDLDLLLCAGHFSSLMCFRDGKLVTQFATNEWVNTVDTADIDGDGVAEAVIGCLDNSICALKITSRQS